MPEPVQAQVPAEVKPADIVKVIDGVEVKVEKEVKKDEKVDEPPEGSKRWNEIYFKAKEGERRVKDLEADIAAMRKHNEDLSEVLKASVDTKQVDNKIDTIKDSLNKFKEEKKQAAKDLDWDKVGELEDKIDELKEQIKLPLKTNNTSEVVDAAVRDAVDIQTIKTFILNTPWMNKDSDQYDEVMADAATTMDYKLTQTWKGSVDDRLKEVKRKIEERFNLIDNKDKPNFPKVGSAGGAKPPAVPAIELTDEEKRVARNMFPDNPDAEKTYYSQKMLILKRRGGK